MAGSALSLKYGETKLGAATLRSGTAGVICRVRNRRCENNQAEPSQSTQRLTRLRITHLSPPFSIFGSILHQSTAVRIGLCRNRCAAGRHAGVMILHGVDHVAEPFFNGAPVEQVVRSFERCIG